MDAPLKGLESQQHIYAFQNPFAVPGKDKQFVHVKFTGREYFFPRNDAYLEYARNACVQTVRDWLQPRLHRWVVLTTEADLGVHRLLEVMLHVLPRVEEMLQKLLTTAFIEKEFRSTWGKAFLIELRQRLVHHKQYTWYMLNQFALRCLSLSLLILRKNEDAGCPLKMVKWEEEEEEKEDENNSKLTYQDVLQDKIKTLFKTIESPTSLLRGFGASAGKALAEEWMKKSVKEVCSITMHNGMHKRLMQELSSIEDWLSWFNCRGKRPALEEIMEKEAITVLSEQIYDLAVAHYPRTTSGLEFLGHCMGKQRLLGRQMLIEKLTKQIEDRVLQVAQSTRAIIRAYATLTDSLKVLDSSCLTMQEVCGVFKEYLKKRPDTYHQLIDYMAVEKRNELSNFFGGKVQPLNMSIKKGDFKNINYELLYPSDENWMEWMPDKLDMQPGEREWLKYIGETLNMIVNINDNKDWFMKEYRDMLAERLLDPAKKRAFFEKRLLRMLKMKFNSATLDKCEVMISDVHMSDSMLNSLNGVSHKGVRPNRVKKFANLHPLVISYHSWPVPQKEMEGARVASFPKQIEQDMEEFAEMYALARSSYKLNYIRNRGFTDLELAMGDFYIKCNVPNLQASAIYPFLEKESWTVAEIADELQTTIKEANSRLNWWKLRGVLVSAPLLTVEDGSTAFTLTKHPQSIRIFEDAHECGEAEEATSAPSLEKIDPIAMFEPYWSHTKMFMTSRSSPVRPERILKTVKACTSPSSKEYHVMSVGTFTSFLKNKVKEGLLTIDDKGLYSLKEEKAEEM